MTRYTASGRSPLAPGGGRPRRIRGLHPRHRPRIAAALTAAAGISLAAVGGSALVPTAARTADVDIGSLPADRGEGSHTSTVAALSAPPVRVRIGAIGLDEALVGLRVQQDGRLGVPEDPGRVGWWSDGPQPGDPGAAIMVGHVDSATGPGAFYSLSSLRPGDAIAVRRSDRSTVTFTVQALRQYGKDTFPDGQVYATTGPPVLRLITCAGVYDRASGEYSDNVVVYATLAKKG